MALLQNLASMADITFLKIPLNHGELIVFVHPNTGHDLEDHRDRAVWIGKSVPLLLDLFTKKKDA